MKTIKTTSSCVVGLFESVLKLSMDFTNLFQISAGLEIGHHKTQTQETTKLKLSKEPSKTQAIKNHFQGKNTQFHQLKPPFNLCC